MLRKLGDYVGTCVLVAAAFAASVCALSGYDPEHQRYQAEGYSAAVHGVPDTACPYDPAGRNAHEDWKKGWIQGRIDRDTLLKGESQ